MPYRFWGLLDSCLAAAVFSLAIQSGCSAYDCEFVWLARDLGLPLVTVDKKALNAFPDLVVLPEIFISRMSL